MSFLTLLEYFAPPEFAHFSITESMNYEESKQNW